MRANGIVMVTTPQSLSAMIVLKVVHMAYLIKEVRERVFEFKR